MAATSPSCLPTTSRWSPSSARAAKMPVSADPGFVKRYSTPASFRVWISNIPPVPVMVLRMALLSFSSRAHVPAHALYQAAERRLFGSVGRLGDLHRQRRMGEDGHGCRDGPASTFESSCLIP